MNKTIERKLANKQITRNKLMQANTTLVKSKLAQTSREGVFVNLKPNAGELEALSSLWNAVDTMIVHNCFIDNNPMRINGDDILFWDWAIVTVNGFSIPAPIHTCSKNESVLYTFNGEEVILSNEECAYTTAIFYLEHLMCVTMQWDAVKQKLHSFLGMMIGQGIRELQGLTGDQYKAIIFALKSKLSSKGFRVLE